MKRATDGMIGLNSAMKSEKFYKNKKSHDLILLLAEFKLIDFEDLQSFLFSLLSYGLSWSNPTFVKLADILYDIYERFAKTQNEYRLEDFSVANFIIKSDPTSHSNGRKWVGNYLKYLENNNKKFPFEKHRDLFLKDTNMMGSKSFVDLVLILTKFQADGTEYYYLFVPEIFKAGASWGDKNFRELFEISKDKVTAHTLF